MSRISSSRLVLTLALGGACLGLISPHARTADEAPAPRAVTPASLDQAILAEVKTRSQIMKNLEHLSDRIGGRLTGSANLEKANKWTAEKMKEYGLENVRLEPWEIPYGWERGKAEMKLVEPNTGRTLLIASAGWSPGTKGKVTGPVVILNARSKEELKKYQGKLKNATILLSAPARVAPITDLNYGPGG
ncbi:MAG: peptidase M28, partial [Gemmataceae bacterium]|nr:peptidase M28 [Gemmataceae bacterium]